MAKRKLLPCDTCPFSLKATKDNKPGDTCPWCRRGKVQEPKDEE